MTVEPPPPAPAVARRPGPGDGRMARRLRAAIAGEVLFDSFSRGRYSTDASIYQIEPIGVVVPRSTEDVAAALAIAAEEGVSVLPRGGGTSQCGQTVGPGLVLDTSKYMNRILAVDAEARTATVEPGLVLDRLNAALRPEGLFFPVDVSTGNRATLGGMAGNNSCGARSIRYGNMVHNVRAIDALMADGRRAAFGPLTGNLADLAGDPDYRALTERLCAIAEREQDEIMARFPRVQRRVGGYNLDMVPVRNAVGQPIPSGAHFADDRGHGWGSRVGRNMAHVLVGSEGTLAFFERLTVELQPIPPATALGVCHFPTFRAAMESAQAIVELDPSAVELVDRTLLGLAIEIPLFADTARRFVRGSPEAVLLVEFAGENAAEQQASLGRLVALMADLGLPDSVVEVTGRADQRTLWEMRKACLNIAMSMKGDAKPVSFVEDCAVRLEDLSDYTERLTEIFRKHGTEGTWYAHASVGTLHVRPILNLKQEAGAKAMRAIAEEAFAMVREYKGAHSGEHGDGIVRSEFHAPMFGPRIVAAFEEVKDAFDPTGLLNPGKIVRPPRMDDRSLFRYRPRYRTVPLETALDWGEWGGFAGAVEMCNNNGACRKADPGVMCPSYRVTRDEVHLTRGRANTLRLALSGQLGPDALVSDEMAATMALCVACKGCRRECPTGVDMARMKTEVLHHYRKRHGLPPRERLIAYLPRYAPWAARAPWLPNARDAVPGLEAASERLLGFSARRPLPRWRRDRYREPRGEAPTAGRAGTVALFADTFNRYFEPENLHAAVAVLEAAGYAVLRPRPVDGGRPLCCGRTFLATGLVEEARHEMERARAALLPLAERGLAVVGLEPSCTFTFRDELLAVLPGPESRKLARATLSLAELLAAEHKAGRLTLPLAPLGRTARLHGHCHQKAFAALGTVEASLALVPELRVETIESSCCGMAGAFGLQAEHQDVSQAMAELTLLPAVRAAAPDDLIVADGTSCRQQIRDGTGRTAVHSVRVLEAALAAGA